MSGIIRYQQSTATTGALPWLPVDRHPSSAVGYGVRVSATATYSVEYTYENVLAGAAPSVVFAAQSAQTTNKDGVITNPIAAVRLNVSANTGTVTMDVLQGSKA